MLVFSNKKYTLVTTVSSLLIIINSSVHCGILVLSFCFFIVHCGMDKCNKELQLRKTLEEHFLSLTIPQNMFQNFQHSHNSHNFMRLHLGNQELGIFFWKPRFQHFSCHTVAFKEANPWNSFISRKCKKYISIFVRNTCLYLSGMHFYICLKWDSIFEESLDLDIFAVTRPRCCIWTSQIREIGDEN